MSATRDPNQKPNFVFTNLYEMFRKVRAEMQQGAFAQIQKGEVLKPGTQSLQSPFGLKPEKVAPTATQVRDYNPIEFLNRKREQEKEEFVRPFGAREIKTPVGIVKAPTQAEPTAPQSAVQDLKKNLSELKDLHSRLKFLLQELEELSKS